MRTSAGVCAAVPPPSLTRKPAMTRSGFACETTTSNAPGAGASTWPSSSCSAKRTDSDDWRRVRSPPKRASAVTHRVRSKKSRGNRTSPSAGPGGPARATGPVARRLRRASPPRRGFRRVPLRNAPAERRVSPRAPFARRRAPPRAPSASAGRPRRRPPAAAAAPARTPAWTRRRGGRAKTRSPDRAGGTPPPRSRRPIGRFRTRRRWCASSSPNPGPPPAPSDCAPTRPSPRETTAKPPSSLADAATNVGGGALVGPGAAPRARARARRTRRPSARTRAAPPEKRRRRRETFRPKGTTRRPESRRPPRSRRTPRTPRTLRPLRPLPVGFLSLRRRLWRFRRGFRNPLGTRRCPPRRMRRRRRGALPSNSSSAPRVRRRRPEARGGGVRLGGSRPAPRDTPRGRRRRGSGRRTRTPRRRRRARARVAASRRDESRGGDVGARLPGPVRGGGGRRETRARRR